MVTVHFCKENGRGAISRNCSGLTVFPTPGRNGVEAVDVVGDGQLGSRLERSPVIDKLGHGSVTLGSVTLFAVEHRLFLEKIIKKRT